MKEKYPNQPVQHFINQGISRYQLYFDSKLRIYELDSVFHANGKKQNRIDAIERKDELESKGFNVRLDLRLMSWYHVYKRDKTKHELTVEEEIYCHGLKHPVSPEQIIEMERVHEMFKRPVFKSTISSSDFMISGNGKERVNSTAIRFSLKDLNNVPKVIKARWKEFKKKRGTRK